MLGLLGDLGGLFTPLVVLYAKFTHSALLYLSGLQKWQWVFWSFCILFKICPKYSDTQLFLVPYSVFAFCYWRKCLSRCKHCSHCSKEAQVPGPSLSHTQQSWSYNLCKATETLLKTEGQRPRKKGQAASRKNPPEMCAVSKASGSGGNRATGP